MNAITNFTVKLVQRYLPDALILAVALTVIVTIVGIVVAGQTPMQMADHWGRGFSSLFTFAMQMALVLLMGYTLALTPTVRRILGQLTDLPATPRQAVALTALISFVACYLNWGFGLVIGAIVAREMGRKVRDLHFPLVVAAAYAAEIVRGPSSSIPLVVATPGNFMEGMLGRLIPVSETLYSSWNIRLTGIIMVALILLFASVTPRKEDVVAFVVEGDGQDQGPVAVVKKLVAEMSFAERLEHSRWVNLVLAIMPLLYLTSNFSNLGLNLNLDIVILIFLVLSLLLHDYPASFLEAVKEAIVACRGIIVQFPLYAGVAGMMSSSGLVDIVARGFASAATAHTFPLMTFLSSGLVNIFIPSGGGQWAVQGPIIMQAAHAIGADPAQTVMAFAWGDAWTNQIQPFWALPLLGVAGLSARDIMGYCIVWLGLSGVLISGTFVILSLL
jgi:short-chain fatty acids transporter